MPWYTLKASGTASSASSVGRGMMPDTAASERMANAVPAASRKPGGTASRPILPRGGPVRDFVHVEHQRDHDGHGDRGDQGLGGKLLRLHRVRAHHHHGPKPDARGYFSQAAVYEPQRRRRVEDADGQYEDPDGKELN